MEKLKRENWKGSYYWVGRDEKGRVIARTKYKKSIKKSVLSDIFKENRSFSDDVKRTKLKKVYEVVQSESSFRPRKYGSNFVVSVNFHDRNISVSAKSMKFYNKSEIPKAKEQAYENLNYRIAEAFGEDYDKDIGEDILNNYKGGYTIKEDIVTYINA